MAQQLPFSSMEESTNSPQVPSNCTSPVCSDPAHDDLALDSEWSDEGCDCVGDGQHHGGQDNQDDRDVRDDPVEQEGQEVQEHLLHFLEHLLQKFLHCVAVIAVA